MFDWLGSEYVEKGYAKTMDIKRMCQNTFSTKF